MKYRWSLFWPHVPNRERLISELRNTLNTRWLGQGPKVDKFESQFGKKFHNPLSVAVSSGTASLHLAYLLSGLKAGDEVAVSVLTCTATNHALKYIGCNIRFVDIDPDTLTIDTGHLETTLRKFPINVVVAVHLGGYPCEIDTLARLSKDHHVPVIYDSAQALGAMYNGRFINHPTNCGFANCFSFQAIKHITTGDGGMLVINNEQAYHRAKRLRWFGIDREKRSKQFNWKPWLNRQITVDQEEVGYKYQMTDIEACFGLVGLTEMESILRLRKNLVDKYERRLAGVGGIKLICKSTPQRTSSNGLFAILVEDRENFCNALESRGVETNIVQLRNDVYKVFGGQRCELPNMNKIENNYIYLPLHTQLTVEDVESICEEIKKGW